MKKFFIGFLFLFFTFISLNVEASSCKFTDADFQKTSGKNISVLIDDCISDTTVVQTWDTSVESQGGFKDVIIGWVRNIATILALLAVLFFVVWSLQLVLSTWDEEKLKKWKDMMKWAIVWFLAIVSAGSIITLLIRYFYYQW